MATRDKGEIRYLEDVELTARRARTHIGIIRDPDHDQPWIVAISEKPGYLTTLAYFGRWGIEPMFPNFKSRGFPKSHWAKLHSVASTEVVEFWSWGGGRSSAHSGARRPLGGHRASG